MWQEAGPGPCRRDRSGCLCPKTAGILPVRWLHVNSGDDGIGTSSGPSGLPCLRISSAIPDRRHIPVPRDQRSCCQETADIQIHEYRVTKYRALQHLHVYPKSGRDADGMKIHPCPELHMPYGCLRPGMHGTVAWELSRQQGRCVPGYGRSTVSYGTGIHGQAYARYRRMAHLSIAGAIMPVSN